MVGGKRLRAWVRVFAVLAACGFLWQSGALADPDGRREAGIHEGDHASERGDAASMDVTGQPALDKALQEISMMEQDFARTQALHVEERKFLQERIAELEQALAEEDPTRADLEGALRSEQEQRAQRELLARRVAELVQPYAEVAIMRVALETAQQSAQAEREQRALLEARIVEFEQSLAEGAPARAELALALQSVRELQADRAALQARIAELEQSLAEGASAREELALALQSAQSAQEQRKGQISEIETAKESVALELTQLRAQFDAERQALTRALAVLQVERDELAAGFEAHVEKTNREQTEQRSHFEARLAALEQGKNTLDEQSRKDVARLEQALADAQTRAAGLQAEIAAERENQLRVLRVARDSVAELNRRIAELESGVSAATPVSSSATAPAEQPVDDNALLLSVRAALDAGNREQAITLFEARTTAQPVSPELLVLVGNAYRDALRHQDAYAIFLRLLEADPGNSYAQQQIVMTLFDMGEYDKALEQLSKYDNSPQATSGK